MQKLKNALHNRRGETIVEVLVAFVLLMLFLALFTASLRFARRAAAQAQTTRDNAYMLMNEIYPANSAKDDQDEWREGTKNTMNFSRSNRTAFSVKDVQLQTRQAVVKDKEDNTIAEHIFTRYYKEVNKEKDNTEEDTTP